MRSKMILSAKWDWAFNKSCLMAPSLVIYTRMADQNTLALHYKSKQYLLTHFHCVSLNKTIRFQLMVARNLIASFSSESYHLFTRHIVALSIRTDLSIDVTSFIDWAVSPKVLYEKLRHFSHFRFTIICTRFSQIKNPCIIVCI